MIARLKELLFQNRGMKQTIAKNVFWLSFSQIGSRLIRAAIIIYAARVLGAAEYGVFSYALGLSAFFTVFADIGISQILTREITQKPEEEHQYFSTAFWLKIAVLFFTTILIIFVAPHFSKIEAAKNLIPIIALITIFDGLREFSLALFRAKEKMELEALVTILTNISITIFGFIILNFSASAKSLTYSYAFSIFIGFAIGFFIAKNQFIKIFSHFQKKLIKKIFVAAYPITLLTLLGSFMLNTDLIMLGWWRAPEEIGHYSAAQKIIQLLYTLPAILATSLFPIISRYAKNKEIDKTKLIMEKSLIIVFLIAIPVFIGGVILANPIIQFIYGLQYLPAVSSLQILLFTQFLIFPQILLGNFILAHNQQKKLNFPALLGSIANIIFNSLLIPAYGIVGSSIATIIAQGINTSLNWRVAKKISDISILKHLKKIITSAIIMGIFSFILNKFNINIIANIIISTLIYLSALYLLKEKIITEIKELFLKSKID
ncbi:flippase [Candidatus Wolfebacteria bacterium]|nr:flippase [Candidatus Wolfebacteria bacterium]